MTDFQTKGELLLGRRLEMEKKRGVPHFKVGQHHAAIVGDDTVLTAEISFVNAMGTAIKMIVRKGRLGEWEPACEKSRQAGPLVDWGEIPIPEEFRFSARMLEALDAAEIAYLERFNA